MITERNKVTGMVVQLENNLPEFKVGDRIECAGEYGTIRYIGTVAGHPSAWLGIDWDNPERGKHNGTVNGTHYFTASYEKSGSFVRPEKVQFGQSALASIMSRYGKRDDEFTARMHAQQLRRFQQTINAPFLEMVGFEKVLDKQSDFYSLQVINLRMQNVNASSPPMELKKLCPNIRELDISKNLMSSWSVIFDICTQLEIITWLNVSENIMSIPEEYREYKFPNVQTLVCGSMRLNWEDLLKICCCFPNLQELRAPMNIITSLTTPVENNFAGLQLLDLEGNPIEHWDEVCKLSVIEKLDHLILDNIGLKRIAFPGDDCKVNLFENLKRLTISNNLINNWESIGELNRLKSLEDLRIVRNPILDTENLATRHQLIIAKIGNLKVLNGSEIKDDERRGAEYDYINRYGLEWLKVKDTPKREAFLKHHNRYLELIEKYGCPEESELVVQSKAIKSTLVDVTLVYDGTVRTKRLPNTMLVQKLILLVQKLFNLQERPCLTYISTTGSNIEINLDDEGKEIGYYSLQNGDQIIVKL